jgi:hypothetical protein
MTALIVIAGLTVMYISGATYNSSFSTILRLAKGAHLSHEIADKDYDGTEPLPKYLEKATISFAGSALSNDYANSDSEYELVSVQAPEPAATQESLGGHADSHRPSTLQSSTEYAEGRESNEMPSEEPV